MILQIISSKKTILSKLLHLLTGFIGEIRNQVSIYICISYNSGHSQSTSLLAQSTIPDNQSLALIRRGYDVYVGKINSYEVDFVAQNKKGTVYFQVALTVRDENTLLRELRPLQAIRDHYPKIILTMDEEPEEQYEGIRRINARDWLLGIVD